MTHKHIRISDDLKMRPDKGYKKALGVDGYSHTLGEFVFSDNIQTWMVGKVSARRKHKALF